MYESKYWIDGNRVTLREFRAWLRARGLHVRTALRGRAAWFGFEKLACLRTLTIHSDFGEAHFKRWRLHNARPGNRYAAEFRPGNGLDDCRTLRRS